EFRRVLFRSTPNRESRRSNRSPTSGRQVRQQLTRRESVPRMTGIMAATAQGLCLSGLEHETRVPAGESLRSHGKPRTSSSPAGEPAIGYEPHQRYRDENAV